MKQNNDRKEEKKMSPIRTALFIFIFYYSNEIKLQITCHLFSDSDTVRKR